jgi:hypothetical protein
MDNTSVADLVPTLINPFVLTVREGLHLAAGAAWQQTPGPMYSYEFI